MMRAGVSRFRPHRCRCMECLDPSIGQTEEETSPVVRLFSSTNAERSGNALATMFI